MIQADRPPETARFEREAGEPVDGRQLGPNEAIDGDHDGAAASTGSDADLRRERGNIRWLDRRADGDRASRMAGRGQA